MFGVFFLHVSTHSRPKAAGSLPQYGRQHLASFNTQPPEGGWNSPDKMAIKIKRFNTQPPEGGWSTQVGNDFARIGFNTQPPEGGWNLVSAN